MRVFWVYVARWIEHVVASTLLVYPASCEASLMGMKKQLRLVS